MSTTYDSRLPITVLLAAVVADTTGAWFPVPIAKNALFGFHIWSGSFGGGTVTIEVSPAEAATPGSAYAVTVTDFRVIRIPAGMFVRATVSSSTTPTALTVSMVPVDL